MRMLDVQSFKTVSKISTLRIKQNICCAALASRAVPDARYHICRRDAAGLESARSRQASPSGAAAHAVSVWMENASASDFQLLPMTGRPVLGGLCR